MDAKELTKEYRELSNRIIELEKSNKYLTDELEKLRLLVSDLQIDIKMLGR